METCMAIAQIFNPLLLLLYLFSPQCTVFTTIHLKQNCVYAARSVAAVVYVQCVLS